jgi:hypothetical protein
MAFLSTPRLRTFRAAAPIPIAFAARTSARHDVMMICAKYAIEMSCERERQHILSEMTRREFRDDAKKFGTGKTGRASGVISGSASANLSNTNLSNANLERASLSANLFDADLSGADLTGAFPTGATISPDQLDKACGTKAMLNPGLTLKPCPPEKNEFRVPRIHGSKPGSQRISRAATAWKTPRRWPRTTKLYDRRGDEITLDEVERINI